MNHTPILNWATDFLASKGYVLSHSPEIVLETPWSNVIRFKTAKENFYLKQTPPSLFLEAKITQLLADQFHVSVPTVIATNEAHHCFLMKDAGQSLRSYLKTNFQPDLLCQVINEFTTIQRLTENRIEPFLTLGAPDWRLDKIPKLYDELINQKALLKADGMTDQELQSLHDIKPKLSEHCEALSQYQIPETLVQYDFHTNNILIDPNNKKMTYIDLGEMIITHPYFSLHNFLGQAVTHHGIRKGDPIYNQLQYACFENWLGIATQKQLLEVFGLINTLFPIYSALAYYRIMNCVGVEAIKSFYAQKKPNQLATDLRAYLQISKKIKI